MVIVIVWISSLAIGIFLSVFQFFSGETIDTFDTPWFTFISGLFFFTGLFGLLNMHQIHFVLLIGICGGVLSMLFHRFLIQEKGQELIDDLLHQHATVSIGINSNKIGQIQFSNGIFKKSFPAMSVNTLSIPAGEKVEIISMNGCVASVKPVKTSDNSLSNISRVIPIRIKSNQVCVICSFPIIPGQTALPM